MAILCYSAVPRKADFSLNVEQITDVIEHEKPKCIFLTSPNNPDGRYISVVSFLNVFFGIITLHD